MGHWDKRHAQAMLDHVKPTNVDSQRMAELFTEFGGERLECDRVGMICFLVRVKKSSRWVRI